MKHSANLSGRPVALITGYRGLAESLIEVFSSTFSISALVRNQEALPSLRKKFPEIYFQVGDLGNREDCSHWIHEAAKHFGRTDVLINNAAIAGPGGKLGDFAFEEFEETFRINFLAPIFLCQTALPFLLKSPQGTVINLSGGGATGPRPHFAAYGASKTALVRMTENLAAEYPELRFYALAPGSLKTPMIERVSEISPDRIGKEHAEAVRRMKEGGDDPKRAAELAFWLCQERPIHLNGRLVSAIWDKYKTPPDYLQSTDLWTLRRVDEILFKQLKGIL